MLTDYAENRLVDWIRGEGLGDLPTDWHLGLVSAVSDSSYTELTGTGYVRQTSARSLTEWAGTQGAGTTLASTGTSHKTSNNEVIDWGTAGSSWGTAIGVMFFNADSPGVPWLYVPFVTPLTISNGDPVSIAAGALEITFGLTGGMSDYLANKLIDLMMRGQSFAWPATVYVGYTRTSPTNAGGGTEPSGSYARQAVDSELTSWDNTQGTGNTDPSDGTSGHTSNNAAIVWPVPTIDQGAVGWTVIYDASSLGNLLFWHALDGAKSFTAGGAAPTFSIGALQITFD